MTGMSPRNLAEEIIDYVRSKIAHFKAPRSVDGRTALVGDRKARQTRDREEASGRRQLTGTETCLNSPTKRYVVTGGRIRDQRGRGPAPAR